MFYKILIFVFFINFEVLANEVKWIGDWVTSDKWQSEFIIKIKKNGEAFSFYGDGITGNWEIVDGNILVKWDNGKTDFIFSGVMGFQRLNKSSQDSYTSGIRKKSPN